MRERERERKKERKKERERERDLDNITLSSFYCLGEPLDVMKRALLCTSTQELASKIVPHMKHIDYPEDK